MGVTAIQQQHAHEAVVTKLFGAQPTLQATDSAFVRCQILLKAIILAIGQGLSRCVHDASLLLDGQSQIQTVVSAVVVELGRGHLHDMNPGEVTLHAGRFVSSLGQGLTVREAVVLIEYIPTSAQNGLPVASHYNTGSPVACQVLFEKPP